MLTELQNEKLTHYFNLLDYDNNGTIEREDFTAIAENLCILWSIKEGTPEYDHNISLFEESWNQFRSAVDNKHPDYATIEEWLEFADKYLVNGPDEFFENYMQRITHVIFDCFDTNQDGCISLNEYIDIFMAFHIPVRYSAKSYTYLDLNNDNLLSKKELLAGVEEFFKSSDENARGNWLFGFWGRKGQKI